MSRVNLSKTKVVYVRDNEDDTMLIRELNTHKKRYTAFGLKGYDQLEKMYYAMISLLECHKQSIIKKGNFKYGELECFLESLTEKDHGNMKEFVGDHTEIKTGQVKLRLILGEYPRLGLFFFKSDGTTPLTGIYLFVLEEVQKLIKFMNVRYGAGDAKFKEFTSVTNDDFIDY